MSPLVSRLVVVVVIAVVSCTTGPSGGGGGYAYYPAQSASSSSSSSSSNSYYEPAPAPEPRPQPQPQPQPTQIVVVSGYVEQKQCLSEFGRTVCGYGCAAGFGNVKCAQQPGGVCQAAFGTVTCWEPPVYTPGARAECKSEFGRTVCGYGCAAGFGNVKCSQHPGGVCHAAYGSITCTD